MVEHTLPSFSLLVLCAFGSSAAVTVPRWTDDAGYCKPIQGYDEGVHRPFGLDSITIPLGESVTFKYSTHHNLVRHYTARSFDACDFENDAEEIAGRSAGGGCTDDSDFACIDGKDGFTFTPAAAGKYWFSCSVHDHCVNGQKLLVVVTEAGPPPPPPSVVQVPLWTDDAGYCKPVKGYDRGVHRPTGLDPITLVLGQQLNFKYSTHHNVQQHLTRESFDACDFENDSFELADIQAGGGCTEDWNLPCIASREGYTFTPSETGYFFFTCSIHDHCVNGQKVVVEVVAPTQRTDTRTSDEPSPTASPSAVTDAVALESSPTASPSADTNGDGGMSSGLAVALFFVGALVGLFAGVVVARSRWAANRGLFRQSERAPLAEGGQNMNDDDTNGELSKMEMSSI